MKNKILAILLIVIISMLLGSCGDKDGCGTENYKHAFNK